MMDTWKRSLVKSITYRIMSILITFVVVWAFTRQVITSSAITLVAHFFKMVFFIFHERVWQYTGWGQSLDKFSDQVGHIQDKPWGQYKVLDQGEGFQVKQIQVDPGEKLSLQRHQYRAELWVVVEGRMVVVRGDREEDTTRWSLSYGDTVQIAKQQLHRAINPYDEPAKFIEVQTGEKFIEGDIERIDDIYDRSATHD